MCPPVVALRGLGAKRTAKHCHQKSLNQCLSMDWPKLKWWTKMVHLYLLYCGLIKTLLFKISVSLWICCFMTCLICGSVALWLCGSVTLWLCAICRLRPLNAVLSSGLCMASYWSSLHRLYSYWSSSHSPKIILLSRFLPQFQQC